MSDEAYQLTFDLDMPEEEPSDGAINYQEIQLREEAARRAFESGESWQKDGSGKPIPPFNLDLYETLRVGRFPFRAAVLVMWLATPAKYRHPKTQEELASMLGLRSPRQFSVWRAKNPVLDQMVKTAWQKRAMETLSDSMEAMFEVAAEPDYKGKGDRELHFKVAGILTEKIDLNAKTGAVDLTKLSYEEKLKLAGITNPEQLLALKAKLKKDQVDIPEDTGDESVTDGS